LHKQYRVADWGIFEARNRVTDAMSTRGVRVGADIFPGGGCAVGYALCLSAARYITSIKHGADKPLRIRSFSGCICFCLRSEICGEHCGGCKELRIEVFRCNVRSDILGECCGGCEEPLPSVGTRRRSPGICFYFLGDTCAEVLSKRCGEGKKFLIDVARVMWPSATPSATAYMHPGAVGHGQAAVRRG